MTDINRPLFYKSSGKPLEHLGTVPVVSHLVRWPGGTEVMLTDAEFQAKVTNERPRFKFAMQPCHRLHIVGDERHVHFGIERGSGNIVGQDVNIASVRELHEALGRWLADRTPPGEDCPRGECSHALL